MTEFLSVFLSYIILLAVMAAAAGIAVALGIHMRKRKNLQTAEGGAGQEEESN